MTKEEAVNLLRANVMVACDTSDKVGYGTPLNKAIEDALNMAIKALEQPTCEDCVSRAELLKKYEDRFIELQKVHQQDKQLGINWCINTLKDMPPVTPTQCIAVVRFSKDDLRDICNERIEIECTHGTCKDCKHREGIDLDSCFCAKHGNSARDDFYCADFEKRGEE